MISLPNMLRRSARLNPQAVATRCLDRERLWPELLDRVASLAAALSQFKLGEGDRIAILSLNSDRYFEAVYAIPWAGYNMVPLNTRWAVAENDYAMSDSGSRVLFFDDAFASQAEELKERVDGLEHVIYMGEGETPAWASAHEDLINNSQPIEPSSRGDDDMAGVFYTGGTTGFPKGVMLSHKALWSSGVGTLGYLSMTPECRYLHAAPMFHVADFTLSVMTVLAGGSHVFLPAFDPKQFLEHVVEHDITHALLVPAMIKMVLLHPEAAKADSAKLERIVYGASPMPAALLEQAMQLWPGIGFCQAYGQTELAPVATVLSVDDHRAGGKLLKSAGRATPINEIRLLDGDGKEVAVGEQGEVVVRGPHAMSGYWNKAEETAKTLVEGWVHTGDAGIFDEQGYLYIVDRVKDMIVTGGENVYTTEVENAMISHSAVQDVSVIGIPNDEWGEAVHAIVILADGASASEDELIAHCRNAIAGYKCPKSVEFRAEPMPLSGAGKVLKTELRKPYWEGLDRQVN